MSPPTFAHGTITDVVQNLHSIATELRRLQAAWLTLPRTYFSEVQAKLNVACAAELVAIDEELRKDTALLAWRARNIFEYFLLFVRVDDEHYAKAFAGQLFTDKIDIQIGRAHV